VLMATFRPTFRVILGPYCPPTADPEGRQASDSAVHIRWLGLMQAIPGPHGLYAWAIFPHILVTAQSGSEVLRKGE
jgi:hypothetical protein